MLVKWIYFRSGFALAFLAKVAAQRDRVAGRERVDNVVLKGFCFGL